MKKLVLCLFGFIVFDVSLSAMNRTTSISKLHTAGFITGKNIRNQSNGPNFPGKDVCKILDHDLVIGILGENQGSVSVLNDIRIALICLGSEKEFKTLPFYLATSMMLELQGEEKPRAVKPFLEYYKKDSENLEKLYWLWHKVSCIQAAKKI